MESIKHKKTPSDASCAQRSGRVDVHLFRHVKIPAREIETGTVMLLSASNPLLLQSHKQTMHTKHDFKQKGEAKKTTTKPWFSCLHSVGFLKVFSLEVVFQKLCSSDLTILKNLCVDGRSKHRKKAKFVKIPEHVRTRPWTWQQFDSQQRSKSKMVSIIRTR